LRFPLVRRPLVSSYTPAISQKLIPKKKDRNDSYEYFKGEPRVRVDC
jgi:hypothetical protein